MIRNPKTGHALDNVIGQRVQWSRNILDAATAVTDRVIVTRYVCVVMSGAIFVAKDLLGQPMPYQQIECPVYRGKTDLRLVLARGHKDLLRSWMRSGAAQHLKDNLTVARHSNVVLGVHCSHSVPNPMRDPIMNVIVASA